MNDRPYADTLNLPKTAFPMRAGLAEKEPRYIKLWTDKYYFETLEQWGDRPPFVLLDGPPYANGAIHIGHAYNKILKDIVNRSRALEGYKVSLIPGWDCHGLPIENKIQAAHTHNSTDEWISECRKYAQEQVQKQKEDFKKLGIFACWQEPYLTMSKHYEASTIRVFGQVWQNGYVHSDLKPVHWCPQCQSSLSLSELEHRDSSYTSIYFKQTILPEANIALADKLGIQLHHHTSLVVWTTTPWTISENQALAVARDISYVYLANTQEGFIVSETFANSSQHLLFRYGLDEVTTSPPFKGSELAEVDTHSPLSDNTSTVYIGDFVIEKERATGIVHVSPAHGEDDHNLAKKHGIDTSTRVNLQGVFSKDHDLFADRSIYEVDEEVLSLLKQSKALVHSSTEIHNIAICWRHKCPTFYLATKQWFINLQHAELHERVYSIIDDLRQHSKNPQVFNNLQHMIVGRQEWCISRQRKWGVPIPFFVHKMTGDLHPNTQSIIERVAQYVEQHNVEGFILNKDFHELVEDSDQYRWVGDTLDIWFDSGCAAAIVGYEGAPVDLVIEGQDQHRGWFQSSLLLSVMLDNQPPYRDLISHGFTLDEKQQKMSKSLGNVITPQEVVSQYGASVLRLYIAAHDWRQDMKISLELVDHYALRYRKLRNTFRFLLAASSKELKSLRAASVDLDKYIITKTQELTLAVRQCYDRYEIHNALSLIHDFCMKDLSAFYIKKAKYRQYICMVDSPQHQSMQVTCRFLLEHLVRGLMPIVPFLGQEISEYMAVEGAIMQWQWSDLACQMELEESHQLEWDRLRALVERSDVPFEEFKGDTNLQKAECVLELETELKIDLNQFDLSRLFGVAEVILKQTESHEAFRYHRSGQHTKCERCWKYFKPTAQENDICNSCISILAGGSGHCEKV
jgi:isoleucyl-tRNA synthetase